MMGEPLFSLRDLKVSFAVSGDRRVRAVDGVSFDLHAGRTLGVVGESGSGKSVTALAVMGLLPKSAEISGQAIFEGRDLISAPDHELRDLRGDRLAMIFQEPMTSLNPAHRVGDQIAEAVLRHRDITGAQAQARAVEMLARVRIPEPQARARDYPHQLSGGMRQRVMIAMALALNPSLLIADEPTTALDVTIQAQILELLAELRDETGAAAMLITHDLGVVAEVCDDVAVMYAGEVVERASVAALFEAPQHPYTIGLLGSLPRLHERRARLAAIPGAVPNMASELTGCRFRARCPFALPACAAQRPALVEVEPGRLSRCIRAPLERLVA